MEPSPLSPSPVEQVFAMVALVALVVAFVFAAYAIRKVTRREWPVGFALTLVVCTFLVPLSGPVFLGLRKRPGRTLGASTSSPA